MKLFKGIGASDGIAIAKVYKLLIPEFKIPKDLIKKTEINKNKQLIENAFTKANTQLCEIKEIAYKKMGNEQANIFQAHIEMLNDPTIKTQIEDEVEKNLKNALLAVDTVFKKTYDTFAALADPYFKERAADIKDIRTRVLAILTNTAMPDLLRINEDVIIVADDLAPSQTSLLDKKYVKGFVTNIGGRTSHAAIIARTLEIPAILGLKNITDETKNNELIAIDGHEGVVASKLVDLDIKKWKKQQLDFEKSRKELNKFVKPVAITKDKHEVIVCANIGTPEDMVGADQYGAKGVGLFRTEFLYMNSNNWPDEEVQYQAYKKVVESAKKELVIIRTLDIGGDKTLPYYQFPKEANPFLGYRAIRLTLDQKDIFKVQLRALLRAASFGKIGVMFPMVATLDELLASKKVLAECEKELKKEKVKFGKLLVGIMIEIPSAAILADLLSKHVDFFSIGTNDLIQYSFAADRMSKSVSYLYQPLNPSLLRLIKMVIDGGSKNNVWTGMCGEMAGDILAIPILLGLGLHEFSMSAPSMLKAKKIISSLSYKECKILAKNVINLENESEVKKVVISFLKKQKINV